MSQEPESARAGLPGIISVLLVAVVFTLIAMLLRPIFAGDRRPARRNACLSNLKQLSTSIAIYESDFDDRFPQSQWMDEIYPYAKNWDLFSCPATLPPGKVTTPPKTGYAMNWRLIGVDSKKTDPTCVLLFEFDALGPNIVANPRARSARHDGESNVAHADTSVSHRPVADVLRETP